MADERKGDIEQKKEDERVFVVLERARALSSELTATVAELAALLRNYDKESARGQ